LYPVFKNKTKTAKIKYIQRLLNMIGLSHGVLIHVAQKDHQVTEEEFCNFILMMRNKVQDMDPDDVISTDQTHTPYSIHASCTLEKMEMKTVHVQISTTDMKQAILGVTVTASGKLLHLMLIFKEKDGWVN
jgi:hypothetical protein